MTQIKDGLKVPGFIEGREVARTKPEKKQPGFEEQLALVPAEPDVRKKFTIAFLVIIGTFVVGMASGALLNILL